MSRSSRVSDCEQRKPCRTIDNDSWKRRAGFAGNNRSYPARYVAFGLWADRHLAHSNAATLINRTALAPSLRFRLFRWLHARGLALCALQGSESFWLGSTVIDTGVLKDLTPSALRIKCIHARASRDLWRTCATMKWVVEGWHGLPVSSVSRSKSTPAFWTH